MPHVSKFYESDTRTELNEVENAEEHELGSEAIRSGKLGGAPFIKSVFGNTFLRLLRTPSFTNSIGELHYHTIERFLTQNV